MMEFENIVQKYSMLWDSWTTVIGDGVQTQVNWAKVDHKATRTKNQKQKHTTIARRTTIFILQSRNRKPNRAKWNTRDKIVKLTRPFNFEVVAIAQQLFKLFSLSLMLVDFVEDPMSVGVCVRTCIGEISSF